MHSDLIVTAENPVGIFRIAWQRLKGALRQNGVIDQEEAVVGSEIGVGSDAKSVAKKSPIVEEVQKTFIVPPDSTKRTLAGRSVEHDPEKAIPPIQIIKIDTTTGGVYYMRAEVWAQRKPKEDIPLCNSTGQPVKSGEKAKLRQSTIRASQRTPLSVHLEIEMQPLRDVSQYLPQQVDDTTENLSV